MSRYYFSPFEVEEQCAHAKRSHWFDRGYDGPALVLVVDGKSAGLRSNGLPRFIDEDRVSFDIVIAEAISSDEVTKNFMVTIDIKAFTPLFPHHPTSIFIDVDNDGTVATVGATIPKDSVPVVQYADEDLAPG